MKNQPASQTSSQDHKHLLLTVRRYWMIARLTCKSEDWEKKERGSKKKGYELLWDQRRETFFVPEIVDNIGTSKLLKHL